MGREIEKTYFDRRDFQRFESCLREETDALRGLIERSELSQHAPMLGLELEAWLVDNQGRPAPRNDEFLARLDSPDVVAELGRFNFELNVAPQPAAGDGPAQLCAELDALWARCRETAASMGLGAVSIGILPTVEDADLCLSNQTDRARYRALNQQVQRQRHGRPNRLDIDGEGGVHLHSEHRDVMLEAAATSFQVHLQVPADLLTRTYNAALLASAFTVTLAANSPLLFGRCLWPETRVPLFEQSMNIGSRESSPATGLSRVTFGSGYAGFSLAEVFRENVECFEAMLPIELPEAPQRLPHLRLHNGTIWRWNRPLVGFDDDGRAHLRIEHRPMAAGPTVIDMMANLAFGVGLVFRLASDETPPESLLPFEAAQRNFYAAARGGLQAELHWLDGSRRIAAQWLLEDLIPLARDGLDALRVAPADADRWLDVIERRVASGQTGAVWQRRFLDRHGFDLAALTLAYARHQAGGEPVHLWP